VIVGTDRIGQRGDIAHDSAATASIAPPATGLTSIGDASGSGLTVGGT